jgi:hypothetical protein
MNTLRMPLMCKKFFFGGKYNKKLQSHMEPLNFSSWSWSRSESFEFFTIHKSLWKEVKPEPHHFPVAEPVPHHDFRSGQGNIYRTLHSDWHSQEHRFEQLKMWHQSCGGINTIMMHFICTLYTL